MLVAWGNGDQVAGDRLMSVVYEELHRLAHRYMKRELPGHTLQTSALVNEAFLRLVDQRNVRWQNRAHFFGVSAQLMRRILVDSARRRNRAKRGGGAPAVSLHEEVLAAQKAPLDLVAFDEALTKLADIDQRKAQVVELRFFGGLSVEETAEFLKVSNITIMRESKMAKAWLHRAGWGRMNSSIANNYREELVKRYGPEKGKAVKFAEAFEICEYGTRPSKEEIEKLFPFE